jgi:glycine/D-amino acid oxidase-like deaminating enzyme
MGLSTAFHLAEAGVDVLLLERGELGSGSTCRAAGGVRAQFSDPVNIALAQRSLEAFEQFGQRPGAEIDLRQHGYLFLLDKAEDVAAFEDSVRLQNQVGVPSRMLTVAQALELSPLVRGDGLLAAAFSPRDGHCTPEAVVQGYARGARALGARIRARRAVTGIDVTDGTITGVHTSDGLVETSTVVATAGAWSASVGALVGLDLPVVPLRRQIIVTEPITGLPAELPMTIDFSSSFYFHLEGPGLLMGMSDPDQEPGFHLSPGDEWLPGLAEAVEHRAPALADVGIAHRWAGLYEMSPDHNALIGEAPEISRFLYATGFSGHGFLQGPAVGEVLRDLVLGVPPVVDVSAISVQRFASRSARPELNCV